MSSFCLISHLRWFSFARIRVLHFLHNWLLMDESELVSLADQLLLELFLALGLQKLLSEGNVGEHRSKCSTEFNGCLGAFLKKTSQESLLDLSSVSEPQDGAKFLFCFIEGMRIDR